MSSDSVDLALAIALPIIAVVQLVASWRDFQRGQARLSPMHYFEKDSSPTGFAVTLAFNCVLIVLVFAVGFYYLSRVFA